MKIVINRRFGGFGLSEAAQRALVCKCEHSKLIEPEAFFGKRICVADAIKNANRMQYGFIHDGKVIDDDHRSYGARACPALVAVVEQLGDAANGALSRLTIVDVPDGVEWEISDYDGMERVEEQHRSWV